MSSSLNSTQRWSGRHRAEFLTLKRESIVVVLNSVRQNYNIGAIFRLFDAFLIERLLFAGTAVDLRRRKLVQAAKGTQRWVPWEHVENAAAAKSAGNCTVAVEQMDGRS